MWGFEAGGGVAFAVGGGLGGEIFGFGAVAAGFGGRVLVCGVEEVGFEVRVVGDGLDDLAASSGVGMDFWESSRTLLRTLEVSGVIGDLGVCFAGAGAGVCDCVFLAGAVGAFEAALALVVVGFEVAASVDFARVVDFLVVSGISDSTGSEMTFFGLPLFLTTSEDIL